MSDNNVPNLDAMTREELLTFWADAARANTIARTIFPDRPSGFVVALRSLRYYASNKAAAMCCRASGDIGGALMYERICQRIYDGLPPYARW